MVPTIYFVYKRTNDLERRVETDVLGKCVMIWQIQKQKIEEGRIPKITTTKQTDKEKKSMQWTIRRGLVSGWL